MSVQLVLSLFPGVGLLDRAFEEEGFSVVRGPDVLWGGDVRRFHPPAGRFDGVIGGPPCQCFSSLRHMLKATGKKARFGNLIPEFERICEEASPHWWLMENVRDAPLPVVGGYSGWACLLNNRQLGETPNRLRRWTFGVRGPRCRVLMIQTRAMEAVDFERAAVSRQIDNGRDAKIRDPKLRMRHLGYRSAVTLEVLKRKQGLPPDFDLPGFTVEAKCQAVVNGVPLAMGRALARAVKEAVEG